MPAQEILRLLPLILRLFPELANSPLVGKVIPLFNVDPSADEDLARQLNRELKVKKRSDFNDKTAVIKVSDAITCVEEKLGNGRLALSLLKGLINVLRSGEGSTAPEILANEVADCIRENSLRQDTPRTTQPPKQKYHRPAVGHGDGR